MFYVIILNVYFFYELLLVLMNDWKCWMGNRQFMNVAERWKFATRIESFSERLRCWRQRWRQQNSLKQRVRTFQERSRETLKILSWPLCTLKRLFTQWSPTQWQSTQWSLAQWPPAQWPPGPCAVLASAVLITSSPSLRKMYNPLYMLWYSTIATR